MDVNDDPTTWAEYNVAAATLGNQDDIAPFPPSELMQRVSGLTVPGDFAKHGRDMFLALDAASGTHLKDFSSILDFGVGSGRLARMFKGFRGHYCGADIDHELLDWVDGALPWVKTLKTEPRRPIPVADGSFDSVISVSVFTHMTEADSQFYLRELHRVTRPDAVLMLTVHGLRALERAATEQCIFDMLSIPREGFEQAQRNMADPGFTFILQQGHLTSEEYQYGISFTGAAFVNKEWGKFFTVERIVSGAIHNFQDIVVLRR